MKSSSEQLKKLNEYIKKEIDIVEEEIKEVSYLEDYLERLYFLNLYTLDLYLEKLYKKEEKTKSYVELERENIRLGELCDHLIAIMNGDTPY